MPKPPTAPLPEPGHNRHVSQASLQSTFESTFPHGHSRSPPDANRRASDLERRQPKLGKFATSTPKYISMRSVRSRPRCLENEWTYLWAVAVRATIGEGWEAAKACFPSSSSSQSADTRKASTFTTAR